MKKYLIIYHKEDNDGLFSCALFYNHLINIMNISKNDIELFGANYNDLSDFSNSQTAQDLHELYENIIMTDISFNNSKYMSNIYKEFNNNFIWCDHHLPIIKESFRKGFDSVNGIRENNRSAILCVWKYLYDPFDEEYNKNNIPEFLRILSAWDSWTYEQEKLDIDFCRDVNSGVTNKLNLDLDNILPIIKDIVDIYINKIENNEFSMSNLIENFRIYGHIINNYEDNLMKNVIEEYGDKNWILNNDDTPKRNCCALFIQKQTSSLLFKSLKNTNIKNGIVFKHQPNNNWVVSLYNINDNDDFDCGEYLKQKHKGGGHKGAAGCTLSQTQFIKILKEKIL